MNRILPAVLVANFLAVTLAAQAVAGSFSPNPVAPGTTFTFTGTNSLNLNCYLPSPCGWYAIHQGTQTGPIMDTGQQVCIQAPILVVPGGTFTFSWRGYDHGQLVSPGLYWIETHVMDSGFHNWRDFFCISLQNATDPSLVENSPARLGMSAAMTISAPLQASGVYLAAVSFSSNNPISALGLQTWCLSQPVFIDALTNPIGALSATGQSSGLALNVPNSPFILNLGLHVQAVVTSGAGLQLTNDLSFTIQP